MATRRSSISTIRTWTSTEGPGKETNMKTSDFNYELPKELIAQTPLEKRDTSRLMTLDLSLIHI